MTPLWRSRQEEERTQESFSGYTPLWFDIGERDEEGNKIFRSLDTGQEQVFVDEEE